MVISELRQDEVEPGEEADYEEQYQGVGEGEQEACHEVFPETVGDILGLFQGYGGVFLEQVEGECQQHEASENLE